jgi:hypothetical protein
MAEIIVGERVLNKLKETGTIISFDGKTIAVQYENRVAKLQPDAFEKGFITYKKTELQSEIDESIQQSKNAIEKEAEEKRLAAQKANEARRMMEAKAPVGVKFNSVSIRLEPAPVSLASVKKKHKDTVQKIFNECDEDVGTFYDAFKPNMKYITPPLPPTRNYGFFDFVREPKDVRPSYFRSRYCAGFLTKYGEAHAIRVFSRNDVYTPGMYGGFTVTNSDTTEIIRAICIDGEIYCFSKHLSCDGGKYKNSNLYKKWQASSYLDLVILDEVIRKCDCKYLNDYVEEKEVNCLNYIKLFVAALYDNKAEILFKYKLFSSIADIDNISDYLKEFTSKQIDYASKNNVIVTLPFIKKYGIYEVDILKKLKSIVTRPKNGISMYHTLTQLFNCHGFDLSVLDKKLIDFLRKTEDFNLAVYVDYIRCIAPNPGITVEDAFDKDYDRRHFDMMLDNNNVYYTSNTSNDYIKIAQELSWIDREENGYYIVIPKTIPEFKYEGQLQNNCVYGMEYFCKVIARESIIVFLRKEKTEPFVTIEFDYETFEVYQAFKKYNKPVDDELYQYIVDLGKRLKMEMLAQE